MIHHRHCPGWNTSCNCHRAAGCLWELWVGYLSDSILPNLAFASMSWELFLSEPAPLSPSIFLPQDRLIGRWCQERACGKAQDSPPLDPAPAETCDVLSCWPHLVLESSYSKLCPFYPPRPSCKSPGVKAASVAGSSSLKYTTTFPSSGVPILYLRVQVRDAVIRVQREIQVCSWRPVSGLVRPWPRRKQPNEYGRWNHAVGTLLKLVHAHNHDTCLWPVSGSGHVNMTKVWRGSTNKAPRKILFSSFRPFENEEGVISVKNFPPSLVKSFSNLWRLKPPLWGGQPEGEWTGLWTLQLLGAS